ncbi:hypothetical protein SALBM311S_09502 [Streptomyces alboniger]
MTTVLTPASPLTAADRCDRCGAQAYLRVVLLTAVYSSSRLARRELESDQDCRGEQTGLSAWRLLLLAALSSGTLRSARSLDGDGGAPAGRPCSQGRPSSSLVGQDEARVSRCPRAPPSRPSAPRPPRPRGARRLPSWRWSSWPPSSWRWSSWRSPSLAVVFLAAVFFAGASSSAAGSEAGAAGAAGAAAFLLVTGFAATVFVAVRLRRDSSLRRSFGCAWALRH